MFWLSVLTYVYILSDSLHTHLIHYLVLIRYLRFRWPRMWCKVFFLSHCEGLSFWFLAASDIIHVQGSFMVDLLASNSIKPLSLLLFCLIDVLLDQKDGDPPLPCNQPCARILHLWSAVYLILWKCFFHCSLHLTGLSVLTLSWGEFHPVLTEMTDVIKLWQNELWF